MTSLSRGLNAAKYPLQIDVPFDEADVKSHAWLCDVELTFLAANGSGGTIALCRKAAQADKLRASLASC